MVSDRTILVVKQVVIFSEFRALNSRNCTFFAIFNFDNSEQSDIQLNLQLGTFFQYRHRLVRPTSATVG